MARQQAIVRSLLAGFVFLGTAAMILLAFAGAQKPWLVVLLGAVALPTLGTLPRGRRVAGWLTAVWAAVALILLGRGPALALWADWPRPRLAAFGGAVYLAIALAAFWSCGAREDRR